MSEKTIPLHYKDSDINRNFKMMPFCNLSIRLQNLSLFSRAGQGRLLHREPDPENIPQEEKTVPFHAPSPHPLHECSHLIIYHEGLDTEPMLKYNMSHCKTLPLTWLIDCIDHFALLPPFGVS